LRILLINAQSINPQISVNYASKSGGGTKQIFADREVGIIDPYLQVEIVWCAPCV
jgi:hypothetical protein